MTPEQERALAIARARVRVQEAQKAAGNQPPAAPPPEPESGETMRAGLGRSFDQFLDFATEEHLRRRGETSALAAHEETVKEKRRLDKPLMDTVSGTIGHGVGDALQAYGAGRALSRFFPKSLGPRTSRYSEAAGGSAAVGAAKPVVGDESRAENAGEEGLFGLLGQGVTDIVGRGVTGLIKKGSDVLKLGPKAQDAATLGQVADRKTISGSVVSRLEEASQSVPVLGAITRGARRRGQDAWRSETIAGTAPDGFVPTGENTREVIDSIALEYGKRYKQALRGHSIQGDPNFESRVGQILRHPENGLLPAQQKEIQNLVDGYYEHMFQMSQQNPFGLRAGAEKGKDFESFLTKLASSYRKAASTGQNPRAEAMADAINKIEDSWSTSYRGQLPQNARAALAPLDKRYAPFKTVERAASYLGNESGDFSTAQLLSAVKARTPMSRFARGRGLLQEEAQAGKNVLGDKLPDSGTPERQIATTGGFGILGAMDPTAASVVGGLPLIGSSRVGRDFMVGDTRLQEVLRQLRMQGGGAPVGQALQEYNGDY